MLPILINAISESAAMAYEVDWSLQCFSNDLYYTGEDCEKNRTL